MTVLQFLRRTYAAKAARFNSDLGFHFQVSGTLDGCIDLAIAGRSSAQTYLLTVDDAHQVIAALHAVIEDVRVNCRYDSDPLLAPPATDPGGLIGLADRLIGSPTRPPSSVPVGHHIATAPDDAGLSARCSGHPDWFAWATGRPGLQPQIDEHLWSTP